MHASARGQGREGSGQTALALSGVRLSVYALHAAWETPVAEVSRRQGLGRRLVEQCLTKLHALGIRRCTIFLFADNGAGAAFWSRCGWNHRSDLVMMQRPCASTN